MADLSNPSLRVIQAVPGNGSAAVCCLHFALYSHVLCTSDTIPSGIKKKKITCKLEEKWHWVTAEKLENFYIHLGPGFLRGIYHDTSANKSTQTLGQLCMSFLQEKGYGN